MFGLELKTFDREATQPDDPFVQTYLAMRRRIGLLGFWLPWVLVAIDWLLIDDLRVLRGSMSAYYHSSARDVLVGGLFVTTGFLISYLRAKRKTYDYWLSTAAGCALLVVALVPTGRSLNTNGFKVGPNSCEDFPGPPGCSGVQRSLGEDTARLVHGIGATIFVLLLAALCFVFALREFGFGPAARKLCEPRPSDVKRVRGRLKELKVPAWKYLWSGVPATEQAMPAPRRRVLLYIAMGILILLAGLWAKVGVELSLGFNDLRLGATYVGEVVAFLAFGIAWLAAGKDLEPRSLPDRIGSMVKSAAGTLGMAKKA
ncbi:DUF998 domain-containing protein [Kribbella speibonae]|uniref:DUF998 domain-containing protein n=1 Tax=Kribbella speibonae TaxID=1572660 RepID=A0A4R0ILK1_9ACTN|nr:hypothetical protein [Kribbella speibonae]TCC33200.1 hypothetical protein E0H92_34210 [Kribbella speibonae]